MFAKVTSGVIAETRTRLPEAARRLDTGDWVLAFRDADLATRLACGWHEVIELLQPIPADGNTLDDVIEIVNGVPARVWTERPKTQVELDDDAAEARAQVRVGRLTSTFEAMRAAPSLDRNAYRQQGQPADLRTLVDRVNQLEQMVVDLVGMVRDIPAD